MYVDEKMSRQLRKGNVAEALFRLWAEDLAQHFPKIRIAQQGYNPSGVIAVEDKRKLLLTASDPDFAVLRRDGPNQPILGISITSQKRGYTRESTMGGMCIPCPRARSCYEGNESNLWYNRYNITNDYPQFRERMGGIDVVLVTLLLPSVDTIFKWVTKQEFDQLLLDYIRGGREAVEQAPGGPDLLHYLKFGGRKGSRTPRKMELVWLLHSGIQSGDVPHFVAGGLSQFGRPREVCCVDIRSARDEQALVRLLASL